jgi:hypothetical protein
MSISIYAEDNQNYTAAVMDQMDDDAEDDRQQDQQRRRRFRVIGTTIFCKFIFIVCMFGFYILYDRNDNTYK